MARSNYPIPKLVMFVNLTCEKNYVKVACAVDMLTSDTWVLQNARAKEKRSKRTIVWVEVFLISVLHTQIFTHTYNVTNRLVVTVFLLQILFSFAQWIVKHKYMYRKPLEWVFEMDWMLYNVFIYCTILTMCMVQKWFQSHLFAWSGSKT